jgi:hypothetical protein
VAFLKSRALKDSKKKPLLSPKTLGSKIKTSGSFVDVTVQGIYLLAPVK